MAEIINLRENQNTLFKRLITAKQLQQIFIGLGRSTIDDWARNGILNRIKIGGCVFYDLAEINSLIENSKEYPKVNNGRNK